jgi:hypothetical protein
MNPQQFFLPELDISSTHFLIHETATIVPTVANYNAWAVAVNNGTANLVDSPGDIWDLLLALHSYATDMLEGANLAGTEQAAQIDSGYLITAADDVQGAAYEAAQFLDAVSQATDALKAAQAVLQGGR